MNKTKHLFLKLLILLTFGVGWSGSAWAQGSNPVKSIEATFNNPNGNTNWASVAITPNAKDASGENVDGVNIAVTGSAALKNPQNALTNEFLGPDDQTSDGTAHTYTFTINGLPAGSKFDKIALPLKGVNSGGNNQNAGTKHVNVAIVVTDGTNDIYSTNLTDKSLTTQTVGEVHENVSVTAPASFSTNTGRLVVKFTISKGTDNAGCYMAFHGFNLICVDKLNDVNLRFVDQNEVAYSGDTKLVRYTPTGGGSNVDFGASDTRYSFGNAIFDKANFSGINGYVLENVVLSEVDGQQTLTFTVTKDPNAIQFSSEPVNGAWADNTQWFTMRNNRSNQNGHNRKYVTTSAEGVNADFNILPILAAMPQDRGSYWCFVGDNTNGFVIQNAAYGPDFVLGIYGNNGQNNIVRMVSKDNIPAGFNTLFTSVDNSVIDDATHAYAFRIGLTGGAHIHVTNGNFYRYNNQDAMSSGDTGSAFKLTLATPAEFDALPTYDVYQVQWTGLPAPDGLSIAYADNTKVFGKRGAANNGSYMIVNHDSSTTDKEDFTLTNGVGYTIEPMVKDIAGSYIKSLSIKIKDALATEPWAVMVSENGEGTQAYKVNYQGQECEDFIFYVRPGVKPKHVDFTIDGTGDKFVWGPRIGDKKVYYDIRERVSQADDFVSGWYQMQLNEDANTINDIANKIKSEEGNVNTQAKTLYLLPTLYEPTVNHTFKIAGLTDSEASSFVYIVKGDGNNVDLVNPRTGQKLAVSATLDNGVLKVSNFALQAQAHPLEGPYIDKAASASTRAADGSLSFNLFKVNKAEYKIYKATFTGNPSVNNVTVTNNDVIGNKSVKNGGYFIMPASSTLQLRAAQFIPDNKDEKVDNITIGTEDTDGIIPIQVNIAVRYTTWEAVITGKAKTEADRIIYGGVEYSKTQNMIDIPYGTVPSAIDFKTNVTDRFVWGPIIDENNLTVTFEVRTPATELAGGKWYQMVLREKAGQVFDGGFKDNVPSMVGAINAMDKIRQKSNYIYPITAGATNWTVELTGLTGSEMETQTYVYISKTSASGVTMMMQNGKYVNNNGEGKDNVNENLSLIYQDANKTFKWNTNAIPWNNVANNRVGIGNTGSAQNGNMEFFMTQAPVKAYKVNITGGTGTLVYNGEAKIIGSKRAANGRFFFAEEGVMLEGEGNTIDISKFELRGIEGTIESITANTDNGITTLTVNVNTPSYDRVIIHRQARYYDYLETEANPPVHGFIKEGEGMSTRKGSGGITIKEQNMAVFEIPVYLKQGTEFTSYMPTDQIKRYQRWYNYDTDGQVDGNVLKSLSEWSVSAANTYNNGHLTGGGYGGFKDKPKFTLPNDITSYNVGLDMAHYPTRGTVGSGASQSLIEPTLAMRIVYKVRDAKIIAKAIKDSTAINKFYEVHNISFPNIKHGNIDDRTLSSIMPLDMDLNNYWIFNNAGGESDSEDNSTLQQLLESGGATINAELVSHSEGAELKNVMMIPRSRSTASGDINSTSFNTGHFVLFQYPDAGSVPANSTATINVYITGTNGKKYNLAQFNLTFIGNSEAVPVTELTGTTRHPDYLRKEFNEPVAELTFDNKTNNEFGSWYKYPVDYKGASYAFGTMVSGGGHTGWFASRGEYGLTTSTSSTGGIVNPFYPVNNYLRNMGNAEASLTANESDSYFLYIDAADQAGKIASIELKDALCAGSRLYCYGYIGCTSGGSSNGQKQQPTSVLINVMGIDKTTGEEVLVYSYCPGIISLRGYDKEGKTVHASALGRGTTYEQHSGDNNYWAPWQQIGFSFLIDAHTASQMKAYTVQIVNNAYNSDGADTVLDDFGIYIKKPGAEVANTTPLCSDQIRHIKVIADYDALLDAIGEDSNHDGLMNVGFCFLDADVYDQALIKYADDINLPRNDANNTYNKAFGEALMGNRTLDKGNKDHAFHNFDIVRDGAESTIDGVTKVRYFLNVDPVTKEPLPNDQQDIPWYSFKESKDDKIYKELRNNGQERYIVFKESVAHGEASGIKNHKWTAGKRYYLLFSTATISEQHVDNHDLGCTVFNLDDNQCSVLYEFTVAPPVSVKGDATEIVSGDEVMVCEGQTPTLTVNLNGRTESKDVVIKNLTYDWWLGYVSHKTMAMENDVPKDYDSNGHAIIDTSVPDKEYNTMPATLLNYKNVWWGTYSADHKHLDKKAGDRIFLADAMLEFRRAYPNAVDLVGVVPVHKTGDTEEYELTQDMINCIAHFLQTEPESGMTPLVLAKKELSLPITMDKADEHGIYHFVVIPIAPGIYSVDEDAIYCPDPQELKILIASKAPSLANGFNQMTYPETMDNVPVRVGLQQINAVRQVTEGTQHKLTIPLRKAMFALEEGKHLVKTSAAELIMVGTDDPAYKKIESKEDNLGSGNFDVDDEESIGDMFVTAGRIEELKVLKGAENPSMQVTFRNNVSFREGYTYTMKVNFIEMMEDGTTRDNACDGSFVFDMKVVPEYQVWTGTVSNDWTNDHNWARADRNVLLADNAATGDVIAGSTDIRTKDKYPTNEGNQTSRSFVPMHFTNVLLSNSEATIPVLYQVQEASLDGKKFIDGLGGTSTPDIKYDMEVGKADNSGNYGCELFGTYVANGVTFAPKTQLINTHYLNYNKAWVEYELQTGRWYTLASPLQNTFAGEWYSPKDGGKQLTPHFYDITYQQGQGSKNLNDRFRPAYYQRSWDSQGNNPVYLKNGGTQEAYIQADWSYVYNDVKKEYSNGGFSVMVDDSHMAAPGAGGTVLNRMPKADTEYTYFDIKGETGQKQADKIAVDNDTRNRLFSDKLKDAGSFQQTITNETEGNNFFLVGNPFMANMDMTKFFENNENNAKFEKKYWIMTENGQAVSIKVGNEWITTDTPLGKVAPLQGFFVKGTGTSNTAEVTYTAEMQAEATPVVALKSRSESASSIQTLTITAQQGDFTSTAVVAISNGASKEYVASEDCETFIDSNIADKPTIYTVASGQAMTVNTVSDIDMIALGVVGNADDEMIVSFSGYNAPLFIYDSVERTYTEILDGTEVALGGMKPGRYFITSADVTSLDGVDADSIIRQGVWSINGTYVSDTIDGLAPGLYIVDGVKMNIR